MIIQKENKTQAALGSKPSLNTTYTPPHRQGKCCTRAWKLWTGTNSCKVGFATKVFMLAALTVLYQLFVSCSYISLLVLLHSSWKGKQNWNMLALSRGELCRETFEMQGTILFVLFFSVPLDCKHPCFTRTGAEVLRTIFSPILFFALKSLVIAVSSESCPLHSMMEPPT